MGSLPDSKTWLLAGPGWWPPFMSLVRITGGRPLAGGGSLDYVEDKPSVPVARTGSRRGSPVSNLSVGRSVTAPDPAVLRGPKHASRGKPPTPGRCPRIALTPPSPSRHCVKALGP
jgi:hypothetical protein